MLQSTRHKSKLSKTIWFFELVYHTTVKNIRQGHRNAIVGLIMDVLQNLLLVASFALFMWLMGGGGIGIRGNFILYVMTGVFLYMGHVKVLGQVKMAASPTNQMLKHAPVSTLLNILAAALSALYMQVLSMLVLLFCVHLWLEPVTFASARGVAFCFFLAWLYGIAIGMLFSAIGIFLPQPMNVITQAYSRANMLFSGKMFPGNTLSNFMLGFFIWNPLFHIIDQARGYTFENYFPRNSNLEYVYWVIFIIFVLAFMIDHWARKYASESWNARL